MPYRDINRADFIPVNQLMVPSYVHVQPFMGNSQIRIYNATETRFVPRGILYNYQSTEPYDGRTCQIILPLINRERVGIQETRRH